jgi:SAM-dependent methyltransferase
MDASALFDAQFWQSAWNEANIMDSERKQTKEAVDVWNRRAKSYDKNVGTESGNKRVEEALAFLDAFGALQGQKRILDIGSGPGNFTLALAKRGHEVVALDPAQSMLDILEAKLEEEPACKSRVKTVAADWVPLDLADYGWTGYFDLVFASMTPGIQDVETLNKAMAASKKYVYLSRFAGPRTQPSVEAVWDHFNYHKPYYSLSLDILFPQNWLYASGYRPALHFAKWAREHSQPMDEAVEEIKNVLALRMDMDANVENAIRMYVEQQADANGLFVESKGATSAMLLWDTEKNVMTRLGG